MKPTHTNSILSCIRACYDLIQRGGHVSQDLGFSDQAHTADGTMAVITDNTDGQQYELSIVPLELAEANRADKRKEAVSLTKQFRLHWKHGDTETVYGPDIASAMNNAGIGAGALGALDYHEEITPPVPQSFDEAEP